MNKGKSFMKTNNQWVVLMSCIALFWTLTVPIRAIADKGDQATKFTFTEAVEVPGQILPAGSYWLTLANTDSYRNVVEIWNADRTHLIRTILAVPDYVQKTPEKPIINFAERPSGQPEAIQSWFYPGNNFGEEFVYPKTRAKQLAKQAGNPVLSMPDEQASNAAQIKKAPVTAVNPSGEEIALEKSPSPSR